MVFLWQINEKSLGRCQIGYADGAKENGVGYFFDKKYGLMTRYEFHFEGEIIVKVEYYYS